MYLPWLGEDVLHLFYGWRKEDGIRLFLLLFIFNSESLLIVWCDGGVVKRPGTCVPSRKSFFLPFFLAFSRPSRRTHKDCSYLQPLEAGSMPAVPSKKKRMFFLPFDSPLEILQRSTFPFIRLMIQLPNVYCQKGRHPLWQVARL